MTVAEVQARTATDATRSRLDLDAYLEARGLGNDDAGAAFAQVGDSTAGRDLPPAEVAAAAVTVNAILNLDEFVVLR